MEDGSKSKHRRAGHCRKISEKASTKRKELKSTESKRKVIDDFEEFSPSTPAKRIKSSSSSFLDKMRARLSGGHFRMINEKLYTCTGNEALHYFKEDPTLFNVYHAGYQEQMSHWPEQPINIIIKWLKDHSSSLVVSDFGCGDARLANSVKNKVFSFDLVSNDPSVVACDMSHGYAQLRRNVLYMRCAIFTTRSTDKKIITPLDSSAVDVAVFSLSLMGTNFSSYLKEAYRVLKPSGWLLIAEVKSRFDPNTGGADPKEFAKAVCELGFTSVLKDFSNKMFILLYFQKKAEQTSKMEDVKWPELKPCLYKRR